MIYKFQSTGFNYKYKHLYLCPEYLHYLWDFPKTTKVIWIEVDKKFMPESYVACSSSGFAMQFVNGTFYIPLYWDVRKKIETVFGKKPFFVKLWY